MSYFVIHVGQYKKTDDIYEPPRGGYIYSKTRLTQDIAKAKKFETEDEAMDFDYDIVDFMDAGVIEYD